jgi:hypothetical protein
MFRNLLQKNNSKDEKVKQLEAMGFDKESAKIALEMTNYNLEEATHHLLSNQEALSSHSAAASSSQSRSNANNRSNRSAAIIRAGEAAANRAKNSSVKFGSNQIQKKKNTAASSNRNTSTTTSRTATTSANTFPTSSTMNTHTVSKTHPKVTMPTKMKDKSKEEQILRCSKRLAPYPHAVDTLLQAFTFVKNYPHNSKYRKINTQTSGYQKVLEGKPGVVDLITAMNFQKRGAEYILQQSDLDLALLFLGISALENIRLSREYLTEKRNIQFKRDIKRIIEGSNLNANVDQDAELLKRSAFLQKVPSEPDDGSGALLQLYLGSSNRNSVHDEDPTKNMLLKQTKDMNITETETIEKISRRFDGDDTLQNIVDWIGAHGSCIPEKLMSREWSLVDLNKYPLEEIDVESCLGDTLQRVGCWPSGRLELRPSTLEWRDEKVKSAA